MAVTGSTRMQYSRIEKLVIASAMQSAMANILEEPLLAVDYAAGFASLIEHLLREKTLTAVTNCASAGITQGTGVLQRRRRLHPEWGEMNWNCRLYCAI